VVVDLLVVLGVTLTHHCDPKKGREAVFLCELSGILAFLHVMSSV
jgi:hypothetical protein